MRKIKSLMLRNILKKYYITLILTSFISCENKTFIDRGYYKSTILKHYNTEDTAQCVLFNGYYEGVAGSYFNFSKNSFDRDKILIKFLRTPSLFEDVNDIIFYGWNIEEGRQVRSEPLSFDIYNIETNEFINNQPFKKLNYNNLYPYMKDFLSPSSFLKDHTIVITGVKKYLGIVMYNKEESDLIEKTRTEFLVPPFFADPDIFYKKHPNKHISELHPLWSQKNELDPADYSYTIHQLCLKL